MKAVYNEIDAAACNVLRELIANNLIAPGDVDERSIKDVHADDYRGYTQVHCFAGAGMWSGALRAAGWEDSRPVWTGSCPCQGFSNAGKGLGFEDPRHLWPEWFRLILECNPSIVFFEQVASAAVGGQQNDHQDLHTMRGGEGLGGFPTLRRSKSRRATTFVQTVPQSLREAVARLDAGEAEGSPTSKARFGEAVRIDPSPQRESEIPGDCLPSALREEEHPIRSTRTHPGNSNEARQGVLRGDGVSVRSAPAGDGGDGTPPSNAITGSEEPKGGLSTEQHPSGVLCSERGNGGLGRERDAPDHGSLVKESDLNVSRQSRSHSDDGVLPTEASVWLDLVFSQLETASYACTAFDLPAAGFAQGAHIRQRFYGVADRHNAERWADVAGRHFGDWPQAGRIEGYGQPGAGGSLGGMDDLPASRRSGPVRDAEGDSRNETRLRMPDAGRESSELVGLGHHHHPGLPLRSRTPDERGALRVEGPALGEAGSLLGCDWLLCRDARVRPVESRTFPLAATHPGRVGALRIFGNGLDFETAVSFIRAYLEAEAIVGMV